MDMNVFLTGALQSGKSTAIDRYLARAGISPGGFRTRWDRPAGRLELYVLQGGGIDPLTIASATPQGVRPHPGAFDQAARLLLQAGPAPLLLMDELGFWESCSPRFQQAVFSLLDAPTPVLGVLRQHRDSPFWGPLSRRPDVQLVPLTLDNRDDLPGRLGALLGRPVPGRRGI